MATLCVCEAIGILLLVIGFSIKRDNFDFIVMFFSGIAFILLIWIAVTL